MPRLREELFRIRRGMILFVLLSFGVLAGCQTTATTETPPDSLTTLILVRHAEKVSDGSDDPPLTEEGQQRAEMLSSWLGYTELTAIYSTPYQRTQATVAPTAIRHDLSVQTYPPGGDKQTFLEDLTRQYAGQKVLICGHSNTIPPMLNLLLGAERYENLADEAYDHVFIVTLRQPGHASVIDLQMDISRYPADTIDMN